MKTVDLPGGATATVREPEDMTERQRRLIRRVLIGALGDSLGGITLGADTPDVPLHVTAKLGDAMFEMRDAAIVAGLAAWSLPDPLPTVETVVDLAAPLYDALADATADLSGNLMLDTSPSPDPASPTQPSSASDGPLRGEETLTPQPVISGANTSTGNSSD